MNFNINFSIKKIRYIYNAIAYIVALITTFVAAYNYLNENLFTIIFASISFSYTVIYFGEMSIVQYINIRRNKWVLTCMFYTAFFIAYYLSKNLFWEVVTICCILTFLVVVFTIICFCINKLTSIL